MYLDLLFLLQVLILENQVFIRYDMLHREVSEMGLRFFGNLSMSYNYVIAIHDRLALFLKCLFLIIK